MKRARLITVYVSLLVCCVLAVRILLVPLDYSGWAWHTKNYIAAAIPFLALHVALRWNAGTPRLRQHTFIAIGVSAVVVLALWLKAILFTPHIG